MTSKNRKVGIMLLIPMLAVLTMGSACQQGNVVQPPTPVVQQAETLAWAKAVTYFGVVEEARHTANAVALTLSEQTPPAIPVTVIEKLETVNQLAMSGTRLLLSTPNSFNQSIAIQVIKFATDILAELSRIEPDIAGSPQLVEAVEDMEEAAEEIKEQ